MFRLGLPFIPPIYPTGAFTVVMPIVTVATLEGLSPVRYQPFMAFLPILARPELLAIEMFFADLDQNLPLAVEEVRSSMFAPLGRLEDVGA